MDALSELARKVFHQPVYIRHNQRRLEHLATILAALKLDLRGKTVLEPGAGVGDHTLFYLDRGARVTAMEPRPENCALLDRNIGNSWSPQRGNYTLIQADAYAVEALEGRFDIVHSYGLLYHLGDPARALKAMAERTGEMMFLETCVSMGRDVAINPVDEPAESLSQAADGRGCRPSRRWVLGEMRRWFPHVYMPATQPAHDEFPTDWTREDWPSTTKLTRAIFIGARAPIVHPLLLEHLPDHQTTL